jgi:hypothetical protein
MIDEEKAEAQPNDDSPHLKETGKEIILQKSPIEVKETQPENMEVHKHPHHVTHKKKWGEYLLEFFMLFLAVFLGFIAENIREHFAEQGRAKEYAKSFLIDLKNDTTELNNSIFYDENTRLMTDSLVQFISKENVHVKGGELYYLSRKASVFYITDWNKATINQLVSSGNLRYFTNPQLVNKINVYNTVAANITSLQQLLSDINHQSSAYRNQIFIAASQLMIYESISANNIAAGKKEAIIDSLRHVNIPLQSYDEGLLNSYANALLATSVNRNNLLNLLYPEAKKEATEIIGLIKKEFHLKDE